MSKPYFPGWLIALIFVLVLGSCATIPEVRWAQMQQASNDVSDYVIQGRRPCVDTMTIPNAGMDHPMCLVDDAQWNLFKALRSTINDLLMKYELAVATGNPTAAAGYLKRAEVLVLELQKMGAI